MSWVLVSSCVWTRSHLAEFCHSATGRCCHHRPVLKWAQKFAPQLDKHYGVISRRKEKQQLQYNHWRLCSNSTWYDSTHSAQNLACNDQNGGWRLIWKRVDHCARHCDMVKLLEWDSPVAKSTTGGSYPHSGKLSATVKDKWHDRENCLEASASLEF